MKLVALIGAVVVAVTHSARSPNAYEAVIEVAEEERERSHAKEEAAKWNLAKVLAGEKTGSLIAASSELVKPFEPTKPVKDPVPAAFQEMSSLVTDMENDAKKGNMDASVQAAMAVEKDQGHKTENTGMEYKVFEAETVLGESEQMRRKSDTQKLAPVAAGQSWGAIKASEDASAKTIMAPGARVQNWENAMSKDLKDVADSAKKEKEDQSAESVVKAVHKLGEVMAKGEQAQKMTPALLENPPKKKLGAVHKDAHVNNGGKNVHVNQGGNKVWPTVMPSMQVGKDEEPSKPLQFKKVPFKKVASPNKVAPAAASTGEAAKAGASDKALREEAVRDLNVFHSDPMYQHLLGPSEDPELSAQTQQDLKLLHAALGQSNHMVGQDVPVVAKHTAAKPPVKHVVAKPAATKPAVAQPAMPRVQAASQKPVAPKHVQPMQRAVAQKQAVPKAVEASHVPQHAEPRAVTKPASIPSMAPAPHSAPVAVVPRRAKTVAPVHVAPKPVAPKPVTSPHSHSQVHHEQPLATPHQPVAPARKAAFRNPIPAKVEQPKRPSHGAKLWTSDMDPEHADIATDSSREDSLEARVAAQATETRGEMEKEIAATDEEFPVPITQSFSHVAKSTGRKLGIPEGYGTKTVPMEGNPSQGLDGQYVTHEDGKSMTKDWGTEYGQRHAVSEQKAAAPPPPVKGGAVAWTASCLAVVLFVLG